MNECNLMNNETVVNEEDCRNLIKFILTNGSSGDVNNEGIDEFQFNKYKCGSSFEIFPINFLIKIMKKYSSVFVNYINKIKFECENKNISELMNNCKDDEFHEILNNFGINPYEIENLSLYHRKHIINYENFIKY
ncbi:hypothetical protein H8356DRAFT_945857 [Neocallimastix lanati (nom. inval.)]|uniref:Uncharacterized protein n=1 Tax=Neocallimastix californiae TaxID=1754190 RepID=A0A1Y1YYG5_9FUNG|nr:hypothetical protein H8356DRAFT_945857 [Neocallimastix sp. JGI-2020a]ORY03071.1 hypothetical protein LY90DRAFT_640284 [Neocallimastix californiae]|eukprot:ORY03071.1 hypothetical protein LY90DRAFT_640284 [Neocallimastix californiae]